MISLSFHSASAVTTTATTTSAETNVRRAVSCRVGAASRMLKRVCAHERSAANGGEGAAPRKDGSWRTAGAAGEATGVLASAEERVCLEARRHGIVLARPLARAVAVALLGAALFW